MPLNLESVRTYCLKKEGSITEEFPFDEYALVFKANEKMFALIMTNAHPLTINLKCDPERAIELREQYPAVTPGYHMNKKHWNTVLLDGTVPAREVYAMIDHSFELVAKGVNPSKKKKAVKKKSR
jgi:predicted DNA-binding protein (MmcQ/YjbR family)